MILLTGGTGFLGSHILYNFYRLGKSIRVLKRKSSHFTQVEAAYKYYSSTAIDLPPFNDYIDFFEWFEGDLTDFDSLIECLDGVDEVFHVAALVSYHADLRKDVKLINTDATRDLVNLSIAKGIKKFHYMSSIAALDCNEKSIVNETKTGLNGEFNSAYSKSKYFAELEVWRGYQEGLEGVIVNPGVIIGPGHPSAGSLELFTHIYNGLKFYPSGSNGYVDVRDVVTCFLELVQHKKFYNDRFLLVSENISYKELFDLITSGFNMKNSAVRTGKFAASVLSVLDGIQSFIKGREKIITSEIVGLSSKNYHYDHSKIKEQLDFEFIPISQSIRETCEFIKENYFNN